MTTFLIKKQFFIASLHITYYIAYMGYYQRSINFIVVYLSLNLAMIMTSTSYQFCLDITRVVPKKTSSG